jgi:predicted permease
LSCGAVGAILAETSTDVTHLLHLLRSLRRSPGSATAAILTLSLTLGAGASIVAVVDGVLLTPPPFAEPDSLVAVNEAPLDDLAAAPAAVRYATFEAWRERSQSIAALEAFDPTNLTLTGLGAAERLQANNITPGLLTLLGGRPVLGRTFAADDMGRPVAMISDALWRRLLNGDAAAIGRTVTLGGVPHTIVGVLPDRFAFELSAVDVWRPFPVTAGDAARAGYRVHVIARLLGTRSAADLTAALMEISTGATPPARVVVRPIGSEIAGAAKGLLGVLAAAAGLGALAAFANLAALLSVRAIDRRRELAIRTALGAGRFEVARQLLIEAMAIVVLGVAGGIVLASWTTPLVARLVLEQYGAVVTGEMTINWRVVVLVSLVAAGCAVACAWLPALAAGRRCGADVLHRGSTPAPRERALRRAFVVGQIAMAFVLLVSTTVLGRSLLDLLAIRPGFEPRGVMAMQVSLPGATYQTAERIVSFYATLQGALDDRLGRGSAAIVDEMPLTGDRGRSLVRTEAAETGREVVVRAASPGYFDVMRIPILAGRALDATDAASSPPRVVVSASLIERFFAGQDGVGRQIWIAAAGRAAEIIGVAGDVRHRALDETSLPTIYLSAHQAPSPSSIVLVRSDAPSADVIATVRAEVARLDRDLPVYNVRSMSDVVAASPGVPARRVLTAAVAGFAALAVAIGLLGLFGVVSHDAASRTRELALRIALGADTPRIVRTITAHGVLVVGLGLVAGGVLSIWFGRVLSGWVVHGGRIDIGSLAIAAAVLSGAAVVAILPPALAVARIDPAAALRS